MPVFFRTLNGQKPNRAELEDLIRLLKEIFMNYEEVLVNYIKPRYLTKDFIRKEVEKFRKKYVNPPNLIPVPIIEIVETVIKIYPIPIKGLKTELDMDGFLLQRPQQYYN